MSTVTSVTSCATTTCAYNHGGCSAFGVTIAGAEQPTCVTFVALDARGGLPAADGHIGACQRLECVHNADLMCASAGVEIADGGRCLSYATA